MPLNRFFTKLFKSFWHRKSGPYLLKTSELRLVQPETKRTNRTTFRPDVFVP